MDTGGSVLLGLGSSSAEAGFCSISAGTGAGLCWSKTRGVARSSLSSPRWRLPDWEAAATAAEAAAAAAAAGCGQTRIDYINYLQTGYLRDAQPQRTLQ